MLFSGSTVIYAEFGVQQGDPLSPLLFCLALQPILKRLVIENADCSLVAYLDDVSILAISPVVAQKILKFLDATGRFSGLILSREKSTLWQPHGISSELDCPLAKSVHVEGIELLGISVSASATFLASVAEKCVQKCMDEFQLLLDIGDPQVCLLLLISCLGMPKLKYCWRTTPLKALSGAAQFL
jgi:hypothetical protein